MAGAGPLKCVKMVSNFMRKQFSTCLLFQGGSFAPGLLKTEVNLHPGFGFSPDQGEAVFLAGGFSSVSPESGFPLSPTLQLNRDQAEIAGAELQRMSARNCRRLSSTCAACKAADLFEVH